MPNTDTSKTGLTPAQAVAIRARALISSRLWRRRLAWAVGGLLLFWGLTYTLVPLLARSHIEKIASSKLGRQVTVGALDFKPWSLELTLQDLVIAGATGPQLTIKRIYIDASMQSLLRLAPVTDAVQVDAPVLSLTHLGDGRYDIDDILERLQPSPDEPASDPPRFALYNVVLQRGRVDFSDRSVNRTHQLRDVNLAIPFLSNLASQRNVKTSPRLAFRLNGSPFDTAAEGTPFAQTRKTDATLKLSGFDLSSCIGYLPASLPFSLQGGVLGADIKVAFEQTPATVVKVSGTVTADKVQVLGKPRSEALSAVGAARHELLAFDQLRIVMDDVRPLDRFVKLSAIELSAPILHITRDRAGRLNLLPSELPVATKNIAESSSIQEARGLKPSENSKSKAPDKTQPKLAIGASATPLGPAAAAPVASPWKVQIARLAVRAGQVNWFDETLASPAQVRLAHVALDASAIALPFVASAPAMFSGSLGLADQSPSATPPAIPATTSARLSFSGTATDQAAQATATVAAWPLDMAAKYVGQFLLPALGGQLDAQLGLNWTAAAGDAAVKPQALHITAPSITLSDVLLAQGKVSLVSVRQVAMAGVDIDVASQRFKAAKMQLTQPRAKVDRDLDRRWMYERWLVRPGAAASGSNPPKPSKPSSVARPPPTSERTRATAPSWAVAIDDVVLDGGAMSFSDRAASSGDGSDGSPKGKGTIRKPVAFEVSAVHARLGGLVLDDRPASQALAAKPMPLTASLRLATGRFEPGKLSFKGELGLAPVQAQGQLVVDRLPVQAFEPYFADQVNIELLRADASFKGRVAYRQTPAGPSAQLSGNLAIEEFKANTLAPSEDLLAWKALNLRGLNVALDPARATRVDVQETVLTDFFARLIVTPEGRINLQDLLKPAASVAAASGTVTVTAAAASEATQAPVISVGPMSLVNGKVLFSDRFVKPNYSANLSDLTGKLSAFSSMASSGTTGMADLELRGKAEGTASLEILGKLNPLAKPLALDITGKVRDLELPPLSPYAVKYSGYGITRGKLSVDVRYLVLPDGQLTANNKIILNQLSFGDKVAGSTASLPVKLAVALLADRNGVIDLDLPISGSLNDPQFSLGPVIAKVILNVIVKAITAPFTLLARAFGGGGDELSTVAFSPGSALLEPEARASLDKVAKALVDRPALKLTVVGTSSFDAERGGVKRARLDALVQAEKRRAMVKDGGTATAVVSVSPAEYPALLKEVYRRTDMTKPRNLVGMAKDLSVDDMEKLLMADIQVGDDAMRELAVQRGVAVRDYLAARELPLGRLFLGAAKVVPPEAKWTPRAELDLAIP